MISKEIIHKIERNADSIVRIRIDNEYYHVEGFDFDRLGNLITLYAFQLDENDMYEGYEFSANELTLHNIELFKLAEIKE